MRPTVRSLIRGGRSGWRGRTVIAVLAVLVLLASGGALSALARLDLW